MEKYLVVVMAIGAAILITGGVFSVYQIYRLVETDARCRGLKHPRIWGFLAMNGTNQSGLILYLIRRRKYPVLYMTDEQTKFIERCKKKFGARK